MQPKAAWIRSMLQSVISFSAILLALTQFVGSTTLITVDEAIEAAFPGAKIERETVFLSELQLEEVVSLSHVDGQGAVVTRYRATADGEAAGTAYVDTHRVRTLPETILIVVDPDGVVIRVEVIVFREPMDYLPPEPWFAQIEGKNLSDDLQLKRSIRPITGATLSARATTDAVRRMLAVHSVLQ